MIIPCSGKRDYGKRQEDSLYVCITRSAFGRPDILGISLHKIYSRLWLYNNHPDLKQKVIDGKMSCEAGRLAARLTWIEQKN